MSTAPPVIPPETANHVLFYFGYGGYQAGSFTQPLIQAIAAADNVNQDKLALGFPDYVAAVHAYQYDPNGIAHLQHIARGEAATEESPAPQCPEALFNPDTGDLFRCIVPPSLHEWHQTPGGVEWRIPVDQKTETPF